MIYKKLIKNQNNIYAHMNNRNNDVLINHLDDTLKVFNNIDRNYNILYKFNKSFKDITFKTKGKEFNLSNSSLDLLNNMFLEAIPMHDIGKINPKFQIEKMENKLDSFIDIKSYNKLVKYLYAMNSYHSKLSALIYMDTFFKEISKIKSAKEKTILTYLMLVFANTIMCHHSDLNNLEDNISEIKLKEYISLLEVSDNKYLEFYNDKFELKPEIGRVLLSINNIEFDTMTIYIWNKILYSLITSCDFIATYSFFKNVDINDFNFNNIKNISNLKCKFENTSIYKGVVSYNIDKNYFKDNNLPLINELRSDILLECKNNLLKNRNNMIFNIESPTGSGKTFNSISCALELLEDNSKLFYVFPVNTLATQTKAVLDGIFGNNIDIQEVNSIAQLPVKPSDDGSIDYNKILLDRQLFNYEGVVTSNVTFFNLLFGCNRSVSMGLISLFNSIIILDEIQNYKNSIWRETIEFLYKFSEIMNIKFIIMSATLPNLEELIGFKNKKFINLLDNPKKYYINPLFKDRVNIEKSLLNKKIDFDDLLELIITEITNRNLLEKGYSKFIIEFITKKSAKEFYDYLYNKLSNDYLVYELDGDDNNFKKLEIINKCKEEPTKNIILVTTQVIEAGVDIDFDLGAKDAVFPDTDEQFLGRINRSCSKSNCKAFFFNLDNEQMIYKDDYRLGTNILNDKYFDCLLNKNFDYMYNKVFNEISLNKDTILASFMYNFYNKQLKLIKNKNIYQNMKLINTETFDIFIPNTVNGINGHSLWKEYIKLIEDKTIPYAKKRILLMNMKQDLSYFTYSLYGKGLIGESPTYGNYYISDGIDYITNGKFNSDLFKFKYDILK